MSFKGAIAQESLDFDPTQGQEKWSPKEALPTAEMEARLESMTAFTQLFKPPENLSHETKQLLEDASTEILGILHSSVKTNINTLKISDLDIDVRQMHEADVEMGLQALKVLDDMCKSISASGGESDLQFNADLRVPGQVILHLKSKTPDQNMGVIGLDTIASADIVVKMGITEEQQEKYTPMQLNFRFLDKRANEVKSLRVDMHNRNDRKIIQVDAHTGSDLSKGSSVHKNIGALNKSDDPEVAFRTLQIAFLENFADGNVSDTDKHKMNTKDLAKVIKPIREQVFIMEAIVEEVAEIQISPEEIKYQELQETLAKIPSVLIDSIGGKFKGQNELPHTLSNEVAFLAWLCDVDATKSGLEFVGKYPDRIEAVATTLADTEGLAKVPMSENMIMSKIDSDIILSVTYASAQEDANVEEAIIYTDFLKQIAKVKILMEMSFD